jgi:hypothetical protein
VSYLSSKKLLVVLRILSSSEPLTVNRTFPISARSSANVTVQLFRFDLAIPIAPVAAHGQPQWVRGVPPGRALRISRPSLTLYTMLAATACRFVLLITFLCKVTTTMANRIPAAVSSNRKSPCAEHSQPEARSKLRSPIYLVGASHRRDVQSPPVGRSSILGQLGGFLPRYIWFSSTASPSRERNQSRRQESPGPRAGLRCPPSASWAERAIQ